MAAHLMAHGFDPVSIPYSRFLEYSEALIALFSRDDAAELMEILATYSPPE